MDVESRLANPIAVITGAGRGLGEQVARTFCREGAKVVPASEVAWEMESVAADPEAQGSSALAVYADVREWGVCPVPLSSSSGAPPTTTSTSLEKPVPIPYPRRAVSAAWVSSSSQWVFTSQEKYTLSLRPDPLSTQKTGHPPRSRALVGAGGCV